MKIYRELRVFTIKLIGEDRNILALDPVSEYFICLIEHSGNK